MPTNTQNQVKRNQVRIDLPGVLDNEVTTDAHELGIPKPVFLGMCVRHGRQLARRAVLGLNQTPTEKPTP